MNATNVRTPGTQMSRTPSASLIRNQPLFLGYLHSFRGFAIVNVVAIHAIAVALYMCNNYTSDPKSPYSIANEVLFHNSTLYFTVISGMLFSVVLKKRGYKAFYVSKLLNVLLPYVFLTLVFSVFQPTDSNPAAIHSSFDAYLTDALRNFIYGKAQLPYWYMPVLFALYLATPLLDMIASLKNKWGKAMILILILLPLVCARVELDDLQKSDFLSLSTIVYFGGAYVAGMYAGANVEYWCSRLKKHIWLLVAVTMVCSVLIVYIAATDLKNPGGWPLWSTLFYIQKMSLSAIFIVVFKSLSDRQPRWLKRVANDAFAIYFLHGFFLLIAYLVLRPVAGWQAIAPGNLLLTALLCVVISIGLSMVMVWIFKKLFGKYSRMMIGS